MNSLRIALAAAVIAGSVFGSAAHAVTFKFTGYDYADANVRTFSSEGLGLTVTAGTFSAFSNPSHINFSTRKVDQDPDGLGTDGGKFESDQIDGNLGNDVIVFTFSQAVVIEKVRFGNVDHNDRFAFGSVTNGAFDRLVSFQDIVNPFNLSHIASTEDRTGLSFGFGAIGKFDNFTIKSLHVSLAPPPSNEPPAVPLPASGLLLLGALAMAGGVSARRRRTPA
ncbi:MAG: hypothetical protein AAFZ99_15205 [Pseudomonadota bacterium]